MCNIGSCVVLYQMPLKEKKGTRTVSNTIGNSLRSLAVLLNEVGKPEFHLFRHVQINGILSE